MKSNIYFYWGMFSISVVVCLLNNLYAIAAYIIIGIAWGIFITKHIKKRIPLDTKAAGQSNRAAQIFSNADIPTDINDTWDSADPFYDSGILLAKILKSQIPAEELKQELAIRQILLNKRLYQMAFVLIDDIDQPFGANNDILTNDDSIATFHALKTSLEPFFAARGAFLYLIAYSDAFVAITNFDGDDENSVAKEGSKLWNEALQQLYDAYGLIVSIYCSTFGYHIDDIPRLYQEAKTLSEHAKILGEQESVLSLFGMQERHVDRKDSREALVMEIEKQYIIHVQERDFRKAKDEMDQLISLMEPTMYNGAVDRSKYRLYGLIDLMLGTVDSFRLDVNKEFFMDLFPNADFKNCSTKSELIEKVNYIFDNLIEYYDQKQLALPPKWCEDVKNYISEHLTDPSLNISMVARALGINPAYASRIFRSYEGMGILDYIHYCRVDRAKQYLLEGMTVAQTAEKLGFSDTRALNRAFLKFEKITPGNFKKRQ